jgi:hypothetical protein
MMAGAISGSTTSRHSGTFRALVWSLSITDSRHFSAPFEGESAELVIASGEGVCVEPENGKDLADQVLKLYQDPARCRALGTNGRHYVLAHFDRQVLARKLIDLMQHVVRGEVGGQA